MGRQARRGTTREASERLKRWLTLPIPAWTPQAREGLDDLLTFIDSTPRGDVARRFADVRDAVAALPGTWELHRVRRRIRDIELRRLVTPRESAVVFSVEAQAPDVMLVVVRYVTHARRRRQFPPRRDVHPWRADGGVEPTE